MAGAFGFFVFPMVGALMVLGPLARLIAAAVGGAGVGALISCLVAVGVPRDQAMKSPPEQTPGYVPEGRPESRLYKVSAPERAEKSNAGSAASCGE